MTEPSVEDIVARWELGTGYMRQSDMRALVASWRERGKALSSRPPQAFRLRVWDLLEDSAKANNLRPGHIRGDGIPDLIWTWVAEALKDKP